MLGPEWDFVEGGATDEITIGRTRQAFDSIMLRPRMLMDMDERDPSMTVLGEPPPRITTPFPHQPRLSH